MTLEEDRRYIRRDVVVESQRERERECGDARRREGALWKREGGVWRREGYIIREVVFRRVECIIRGKWYKKTQREKSNVGKSGVRYQWKMLEGEVNYQRERARMLEDGGGHYQKNAGRWRAL